MRLRDIIDSPCGIRYMLDTLPLSSGFSQSVLLDAPLMTAKEDIEQAYSDIRRYQSLAADEILVSTLAHKLCRVKDISRTISRIATGAVVDDIELFEVKLLVLTALDVREIIARYGLSEAALEYPCLEKVLGCLDPDGMKIASFYIFDSYSAELAQLRRDIETEKDEERAEALREEERQLQARIRIALCKEIAPYAMQLTEALYMLAQIDIRVAKAQQIAQLGLTMPELDERTYIYKGMFHPFIKSILTQQERDFTPIDITLQEQPVLLIGANMGGKTVVLKMLAQNQYLCQWGFGIPAQSARIVPKDEIFFISGDAQNIATGLSSFAAEMTAINAVVKSAEEDCSRRIIALIDEPARSTNPIEGTALVEALIEVLKKCKGMNLAMTTHYNISSRECLRYKVQGLENGKMNYRLGIAADGEIPHEAIGVAESLNISPSWIGEAKKLLNKTYDK